MNLFIFGIQGYTSRHLITRLVEGNEPGKDHDFIVSSISGTCLRGAEEGDTISTRLRNGVELREHVVVVVKDGYRLSDAAERDLMNATHVLSTVAPSPSSGSSFADPVLQHHSAEIEAALLEGGRMRWLGYLSTTGVYGDKRGGMVTEEETELRPSNARGKARLQAEIEWRRTGAPIHIFRLPGIYGEGRGNFEKVVRGETKSLIVNEAILFSRIHVEDICETLVCSMMRPNPGRVYNVADDCPERSDVVSQFCFDLICEMEGKPRPPLPRIPFAEAEKDMSPMARSFYTDSKIVSNERMKRELGVRLKYPSYREGMRELAFRHFSKLSLNDDVDDDQTWIQNLRSEKNGSTTNSVVSRSNSMIKSSSMDSGNSQSLSFSFLVWRGVKIAVSSLMRHFFLAVFFRSVFHRVFSFLVGRNHHRRTLEETSHSVVILVDGGSLRPAATLGMRRLAKKLMESETSKYARFLVASLKHADKIPKEDLNGEPAMLLSDIISALTPSSKILLLPMVVAGVEPMRKELARLEEEAHQKKRNFTPSVVIAPPLFSYTFFEDDDKRFQIDKDAETRNNEEMIQIILSNIDKQWEAGASNKGVKNRCVVMVDHGTRTLEVNRVRRIVASRLRRALVRKYHATSEGEMKLVDCCMERRPERKYDFNDPLFENVFDLLAGESNSSPNVLVVPAFLFAGNHAGKDGDLERIVEEVRGRRPNLGAIRFAPLICDEENDEALVRILRSRVEWGLRMTTAMDS